MKRNITVLSATAVFAASVSMLSWADQTTPVRGLHERDPQLVALTNATLITEPGQRVENATLVIERGIIRSIERNNRAPAGARVIDATGYTIYPGFIDPYSNYGVAKPEQGGPRGRSQAPVYSNEREGGNASNAAIHAEKNWYETAAAQSGDAKRYIEQGFTSVQSARFDGIFRGRATTLSLADRLPNDIIYRPQTAHFASFDKGSSTQQYPSSLMGSIALIRQTLSDANWYKEAQGLSTSNGALEFNAALSALSNIASTGVVFDASDELNALRAARVFAEFSLPITVVGSGFEYARINELKAANMKLILPLNYPAAPELNEQFAELDVSLADLRHWERAPGNAAVVANADIPFALTLHGLSKTSDFWPNVRKAIDHGLSPQRALAALTTVPAEMAGIADQAGRLAAGYRADFVVSRGDLFDQGEIVSVWLQGEENELKPMNPADFSGEYALTLGDKELTLTLSGNGRMQGKLVAGETEVNLRAVSADNDSVSFMADLGALDLPGTYRFAMQHESLTSFSGRAVSANGSAIALSATRDEPEAAAAETQRNAGTPEYVGRLTWPNVGFGVSEQPTQANLHIRNATVWTADDQGILENADILVRNGRIQRVGQNLSTPRGYEVIDATGMHITPGLIDEHSHIAISQGVNEGSEAVTAEVRIGDVVNPDDIHIYRSLAGGATVAHLLHGSANPIGGQGQAIKLRWGQGSEGLKFAETPATIKMALGENVKQSNWGDLYRVRYPQTRMGVAALIRDYFQAAREYEQAQRDYARLSRSERRRTAPPRRDYRLDTLVQILNSERYTHVHSYVASEVLALLDVADELGFKIHTFTHILEGYKVANEIAAHGAGASSFADWWGFKFEVYDAIPYNACILKDAGVLTSLNSDSNDLQRRLNTEAAKSVRYCGMDEHEALKLVTLYPAQQLEIADYVGSITAGKHADFVIWNNHPLSAYARPQQTWIEGRKYFDREVDAAQRERIAEERAQLVEAVLSAGSEANRGERGGYRATQPTWHCETTQDVWRGFETFEALHQHDHSQHSEGAH
ncbi:amidohydrolase family protein [Aliidiomarina celeris]|uniref:amidohydrolase family protein n=1 Tax=Aliidiomarina celeris TaxID=2249428 RepID=UPI000DEA9F9F|nr:amidohydrolase family protein [Aliidiomarina celeris]